MNAVITALAISAVAFAVLALWLAWEHAQDAEQIRDLEAALDEAERIRDQARADLRAAEWQRDGWRETAELFRETAGYEPIYAAVWAGAA